MREKETLGELDALLVGELRSDSAVRSGPTSVEERLGPQRAAAGELEIGARGVRQVAPTRSRSGARVKRPASAGASGANARRSNSS